MGIFKRREPSPEELEPINFEAETLEPAEDIPAGTAVMMTICPGKPFLYIRHAKGTISLPFERLLNFSVDTEKKFNKKRRSLGRAIAGAPLYDCFDTAATATENRRRRRKWLGALQYYGEEGETLELSFTELAGGHYYEEPFKSALAYQFETIISIAGAETRDKARSS